jgi:hypothetical protein
MDNVTKGPRFRQELVRLAPLVKLALGIPCKCDYGETRWKRTTNTGHAHFCPVEKQAVAQLEPQKPKQRRGRYPGAVLDYQQEVVVSGI